ncbi:unnamed protein product [Pocillopora meandrina]|uniref:Uncharacterized protein n=1 Tax=Pocillopora meandrina TaxID=46732 RepID=A0AAU9WQP2_9CNID|nr:unnamed protein product [Pocillopora meandrina]
MREAETQYIRTRSETVVLRNISFTKLKALLSFQLDAMVRARNAYQNWHAAVHGDVAQLLPLRQENIKAFCADLAKAGYAPNTIIQLYLAGLCTWVSLKAYLRRFVGIGTHMKKEALFPQDVEHLIDTCGIDTPQQLQLAFIISASFHSGCRQGSLTRNKRRPLANELLEELGSPPPVRESMRIGQLSFLKDDDDNMKLTIEFQKEK